MMMSAHGVVRDLRPLQKEFRPQGVRPDQVKQKAIPPVSLRGLFGRHDLKKQFRTRKFSLGISSHRL